MKRARHVGLTALLWGFLAASAGWGQGVEVPNASFEAGTSGPEGWTLSGGQGKWLQGGTDGKRAVSVTGAGQDSNYWRSGPLALKPTCVYRIRFRARRISGAGGTPVTGPVFCNLDLRDVTGDWRAYAFSFVTPAEISPQIAWLRFGQWRVKGTVAFDQIELHRAEPIHRRQGEMVLGEGEAVQGRTYTFQAPLAKDGRNHSRPLVQHRCGFNSLRWVFGADGEVIYRHEIAGRQQTAANVEVTIGWHSGGRLVVEAGRDGKAWRRLGVIGEVGTREVPVPKELLPARGVWVRLRSEAKKRLGKDSDPGSFQVYRYSYRAKLAGEGPSLRGGTKYMTVTRTDPRVKVAIDDLGECLPGGKNVLVARVENTTGKPIAAKPTLEVSGAAGKESSAISAMSLPPGATPVRLRYTVPGVGPHRLAFALGGEAGFRAETTFRVPELHDSSYGQTLPASTDRVGLWWASSGWKISRTRPAPRAKGQAIVIRAAKNEAEAVQLVVRPRKPLRNFLARGGPLVGPDGATIPAANVEVLRVRYVQVTQPTDRIGAVAPWPDPLPPFRGPIDLAAERNQPLWVRVKVPRGARAGLYKGAVALTADGYEARVPLAVEVYDFALPDRMTCRSAFGFSVGNVWRYQRLTAPDQRRAVLDKYLRNFSEHHISPYDPAPLDPLRVTWEGAGHWTGGRRDRTTKHSGQGCLKVEDNSPTAGPNASYGKMIRIPEKGLRFRFWHKAAKGHRFIATLNHHDAMGKWMSGRNNDMRVEGTGGWAQFDRTVTAFPEGAVSVRLSLWPALYAEDGSTTGTVWYDDLRLQDAGTQKDLVEGGHFEPVIPRPRFDFTAWDKAMGKAVDQYYFNTFRVPIQGLGGGTFHARHEPNLLGYAEDTAEYKAAFTAYCRTLQEHLREKGWLDEAFVYWFDEPDPKDYAFVMNGFRKLKAAAPGLGRMLTEQIEPALIGGPDIWCPVSPNYDHQAAEKRRAHGERFWWYICCGPKAPYCGLFIDHPGTELRVWLWQTWQRKIEAVLIWQTNYWTSSAAYPDSLQNPYEDPMGWVSGYSTPRGTKRPWGNGDGRFIYPPEAAAKPAKPVLDGPVDSIRWEMLRDGIEDYEYLAILQRLLKAREDKLPAGQKATLRALLVVPPSITKDMTTFTKDPAPIEHRRNEIARAIEMLTKK